MDHQVAVVAGGAGFLGSRLCEVLLDNGMAVLCLDDLSTGELSNLDGCFRQPGFTFRRADVTKDLTLKGKVDYIFHLASPASPAVYMRKPVQTLLCGSHATLNLLKLAEKKESRFILASTSEVYGDPTVHPQPETYFGNVDPTGSRSCYDEAKRFAEAMTAAFHRRGVVSSTIARIFNSYGPRLRHEDGRVVSNFVSCAITGRPLSVYGSGVQTRSLCYVDDTVAALALLRDCAQPGPFNIGSTQECTIIELAQMVRSMAGSNSTILFEDAVPEDPRRRRPDLTRTQSAINWSPVVSLEEGLARTIEWHRMELTLTVDTPTG